MTGRWVTYILAGISVVCFTTVFLIGAVRRLRSRGEVAGVPEHSDDRDVCADGPDCAFCRGMEAYIRSQELNDRLGDEVAVNLSFAAIADEESDLRRIEREVLAEEGWR